MNYYSMCHELSEGDYTNGEVFFSPPLQEYYALGEKIDLNGVSVSVRLDKKIRLLKSEFFLTGCGAFFVSEKLKETLEGLNTSLIFLAADIKHYSGKDVDKRYYLIHCEELCWCFDYDASEYSGKSLVQKRHKAGEFNDDYKVRGVKKIAIDQAKAGPLDLFFIGGVIWIDPIVSEQLVEAVEAARLRIRFLPLG